MYHFFQSIDNIRGDALIGYFVKAVDTVTDDTVSIYADSNSTPIISVSGVADMAQVDSDGDASFWIVDGEYHLDIYATDATTFIKRIADLPMNSGPTGPTGAQGPAGDVAKALTRTDLAGIVGAAAGMTRCLAEAGREGTFVFKTAAQIVGMFGVIGLSATAIVTADTAQGVLVAPSSDTTGASGAWVRQFSGPRNVKWFGAVGDDTTNDFPAFNAALSYLQATALTTYAGSGLGYGGGGSGALFVPRGAYYLAANTLEIHHNIRFYGESTGDAGAGISVLRWAANCCGIRTHSKYTNGFNDKLVTPNATGADGTIIEGLHLIGGYVDYSTTPENEQYPAIQMRTRTTVRNVFGAKWQGVGVRIYAASVNGDGANPEYGNANNWKVENCCFQYVLDVMQIKGGDSNSGCSTNLQGLTSRRHGVWDNSFLGNEHINPLVQTVATTSENDGVKLGVSQVTDGTNWYCVRPGQATAAMTAAPTTGVTDANWYFMGTGGVAAGIPLWFSGILIREAYAYYSPDIASKNKFEKPYSEGNCPPSFIASPNMVVLPINATWNPWLRSDTAGNYSGLINVSLNKLIFGDQVVVQGVFQGQASANSFGPQTGTLTSTLNLDNASSQSAIAFRSWSAGVSQIDSKVYSARGGSATGNLYLEGYANGAAGSVLLRSGTNEMFRVDPLRATVKANFPLNLGPGTAPATPANGDLWYDSTSATFRKRANGVTYNLGDPQTYTFATLPASPSVGQRAFITDCNVATFGTAAAAGGANKVPVFYDGAWKVG